MDAHCTRSLRYLILEWNGGSNVQLAQVQTACNGCHSKGENLLHALSQQAHALRRTHIPQHFQKLPVPFTLPTVQNGQQQGRLWGRHWSTFGGGELWAELLCFPVDEDPPPPQLTHGCGKRLHRAATLTHAAHVGKLWAGLPDQGAQDGVWTDLEDDCVL
jgi:hypothetical protein